MIAYIDDDPSDRMIFGKMCEDLGVRLRSFSCIEDLEGEFDHVFTDLSLTKHYQWEVIKALREKYNGPITAVSGLGAADIIETYKQKYDIHFIRKSELTAELIEKAIALKEVGSV